MIKRVRCKKVSALILKLFYLELQSAAIAPKANQVKSLLIDDQ